jgi:signal transduction histidine kinase
MSQSKTTGAIRVGHDREEQPLRESTGNENGAGSIRAVPGRAVRRRFGAITRAYHRWVNNQDAAFIAASTDGRNWLGVTVLLAVTFSIAGYAPVISTFFQLEVLPATLCYLPALVLVHIAWLGSKSRFTAELRHWLVHLLGSALIHFFVAATIAWSSPQGAAVLASLLLFTAGYHGHIYRATIREPFLVFGTLAGCLAAAALRPDEGHLPIFAFAIPTALGVQLVSGANAVGGQRLREETERLRAAVRAQILDEQLKQQDNEMRRLSQTLVDVLSYNHDINNLMMSATLAAEALSQSAADDRDLDRANLGELAKNIRSSLNEVRALFSQFRAQATAAGSATTDVIELVAVVEAVVAAVQARFTRVLIEYSTNDGGPLRARVSGGILSARRIAHNLVQNACEGNGRRRSSTVTVRLTRDRARSLVCLTVEDDGPGFATEQLSIPIEGFASSKAGGTGLGLYTTERLVRASGGTIVRENRSSGGARVTVMLPLAAS